MPSVVVCPIMRAIEQPVFLDIGVDFSVADQWWSQTYGVLDNDPSAVANPLLNGRRTLYGMLTADGTDPTGNSSELYAVTRSDKDSLGNNGAWKIIGAGDERVRAQVTAYKQKLGVDVLAKDEKLQKLGFKKYLEESGLV